ncbi:MAG TPA: hypothetical protein VNS62_10360 [Candidatus Udaeobacter sp.]|nr:hypothetical protein [Candidatus Udaeobacter sp.]
MKWILSFLTTLCLLSAFATADVGHASLEPVKHRERHQHAQHHAHRAGKHHARHRHYRSV